MKYKIFIIIAFAHFFPLSAIVYGQTEKDIEGEYGSPRKTYKVCPSIYMVAYFAGDGQLSKATLYYNQIDLDSHSTSIYAGQPLPWWQLKKALAGIAPKEKRGLLIKVYTSRDLVPSTTYKYENVEIIFTSFTEERDPPVDLNKQVMEKFSPLINTTPSQQVEADSEDFSEGIARFAEFVQIIWVHKK